MLYPLGQELQCANKSHKVQVSEPMENNANTEMDSDKEKSDIEEKQEYEGPLTRARTKALAQANMVMAQYFDTKQCVNKETDQKINTKRPFCHL